jgi:hypothetical protein
MKSEMLMKDFFGETAKEEERFMTYLPTHQFNSSPSSKQEHNSKDKGFI